MEKEREKEVLERGQRNVQNKIQNGIKNQVLEAIRKRYSCKSFTGAAPSQSQLQAIAEAAIQAPSAMNRQRWRVVVVTNKLLIDELEAEAIHILRSMPDKTMYERITAGGKGLFYGAPAMIVVPIEVSSQPMEVAGTALDAGILCENVALAAASMGIGNLICGLTGLAFAGEKTAYFKQKLGFPEGYEFGVSILLGEALEETAPHVPDPKKITFI